jgi:carbonic anhydrase/acetyltransferase-like protein (isoleucine patch superfamily)
MIYQFLDSKPVYNETNFIAPSADIIGDVELGKESSVWFNCTVRGDVNYIRIGSRTNIQDNTCIHVMNQTGPTIIGDEVTVGHSAMIHGCTIGDRVLIGMKAIILDKAVIEPDCIIAAGSLVSPGKTMPSGWLCMGSPARPVRELTREERKSITQYSDNYVKYSRTYLRLDTYDSNPYYTKP